MIFFGISRLLLVSLTLLTFLTPLSRADELKVPNGFQIEEFAGGLGTPRFMALSPDNALFVTVIRDGTVLALADRNNDGKADESLIFIRGLEKPHGIAFHDGYIYVGETNQIVRFKYKGPGNNPGDKEIVVPNLPTGGHFTRTVSFGPDGKMYVSIGSSCNVCVEDNKRRATIMRFNPDGSDGEIFATGLRNSVGLTWHPRTKELWATDNGRDWLGDDLPPDEVNVISQKKDYGWPYCYGDKTPDPDFNNPRRCEYSTAPVFEIEAHSAPLGLTFYDGKMFPSDYKNNLFIAYHGSWNRSAPTGYKVVRVKMDNGKPQGAEDFVQGWLSDNKKYGRPVDVLVGEKGELYITDDFGGKIYKVTVNTKSGALIEQYSQ
jgi:glucose/arabinose dehydrogenase